MARERIIAVDAARGSAMLLVCLSHIKHHFEVTAPALHWFLLTTTRIATPTFLLLSGFVIGHLLRTDTRGNLPITLVDRGLFLLIVAHMLLGIGTLPDSSGMDWIFGRAMLTDAIGVALFLAVLMRGASVTKLMCLGVALCIGSWIITTSVTPESPLMQRLVALLFSAREAVPNPEANLPLLPFAGMFMMGMALNAWFGRALAEREYVKVSDRLLTIGLIAVAVVLAGVAAWHFGKALLPEPLRDPEIASKLRMTLDPRSKQPPSPAYFLFYGGSGLIMLAVFFRLPPRWLEHTAIGFAATIGKASLLCFIVQDWLFFLVPSVLGFDHITSIAFWFAYLGLSVALLYVLARAWNDARGNRFLTVGLKALSRSRAEPVQRRTVGGAADRAVKSKMLK